MLGGNSRNRTHKRHGIEGTAAACAALTVLGLTAVPAAADTEEPPNFRPEQWGATAIGASELWEETQGQGTVAALVGPSVHEDHPDLRDNLEINTEFGDNGDDVDEGTAMASLVAAHGHGADAEGGVLGVAPSASLLALPTEDDLEGAIRFAADEGAQVILLSETDEDLSAATAEAVGSGAVVVAPTGATDDPNVVTVAGTDQDGVLIEESSDNGDADLTAPGDELDVIGPELGETQVTGEPYAAALTAGGVALLRAAYPQLQPEQVHESLVEGSQEGPEGLPALNLPEASAHAAGVAQDNPLIDQDLVEESESGREVPVWVWFAVVGAVLLFGVLALVVWVRSSTKDPYGVESERREEDERIAADRAAEAEKPRRRGGRRRKPRRG